MHHRISLRVSHRTCSLQAIVAKLALGEPRIGRSVGDERATNDGRVIGINRETFCTYELATALDDTLENVLESIVPLLEKRESALLEIVMDGGSIEIYAGIFLDGAESAGFTLPPSLAHRIARLNLTTTIEIYS